MGIVRDRRSLHADVPVPARRRDQLERVCRYILRPPLALERLTESTGGQLLYQFRRPWRDGSTALLLDPLALLGRLAALVPPPRRPLLAYHGAKIAIVREVAGVQVPRTPFATPPAELVKLAGYRRDIRESRTEARRLLAEAEIAEGTSFVLKNRNIPMPYAPVGAWLVNQWREIGLMVHQEVQDCGQYFKDLRAGNFELSTDFQCGYVVDPDLDLYKFQSRDRSDANYGRYTDPVLDDLYVRQSRTVDPERRRQYIRAFEKRLLDEEAHYIYMLQWHRIVPHSSRVRGWTITPSHYLNSQLDTVWLAE